MSLLTELKKYSVSEEYTNMVAKYRNIIEYARARIEADYTNGTVDKLAKYSTKDILYEKNKIYRAIAGEVIGDNSGIQSYRQVLIKEADDFMKLIYFTTEDKGRVKSTPIYTELDLETEKINAYIGALVDVLNGLIMSYTKQKQEDYNIY